MSQHSSLKGASVSTKHRNVLKRYERVRNLHEREKWGDRKSIYNLPKIKMIKLKVKKTKGPSEEGGADQAPEGGEKVAAEKGNTEKAKTEKAVKTKKA